MSNHSAYNTRPLLCYYCRGNHERSQCEEFRKDYAASIVKLGEKGMMVYGDNGERIPFIGQKTPMILARERAESLKAKTPIPTTAGAMSIRVETIPDSDEDTKPQVVEVLAAKRQAVEDLPDHNAEVTIRHNCPAVEVIETGSVTRSKATTPTVAEGPGSKEKATEVLPNPPSQVYQKVSDLELSKDDEALVQKVMDQPVTVSFGELYAQIPVLQKRLVKMSQKHQVPIEEKAKDGDRRADSRIVRVAGLEIDPRAVPFSATPPTHMVRSRVALLDSVLIQGRR